MSHGEHILHQLEAELGFSSRLVGGKKSVVAQIERFLARTDIPDDLNPAEHPLEWKELIAEVVVPETSFFRYPESFTMLRGWAAARPRQSLRGLCVPCSTGEEAYSIAITLREAGGRDFQIDAFDASEVSVSRARAGRYAERTVRGLPDNFRDQWFDAQDDGIVVTGSIHAPIQFRAGNIFTMEIPGQTYDFIFCRNLLIYLDAENQHLVFRSLEKWLKPDGILFLGPGEATTAASHGWTGTGHAMSFSFTRANAPSPAVRPRIALPKKLPTPPLTRPIARRTPIAAGPPATRDWLTEAADLADAGNLAEASSSLIHFHDHHPATAASLSLQGIIAEAQGHHDEAEAAYRKAIYLEPAHLDALLHLCLLLESNGRASSAAPFRGRIDRLTATR